MLSNSEIGTNHTNCIVFLCWNADLSMQFINSWMPLPTMSASNFKLHSNFQSRQSPDKISAKTHPCLSYPSTSLSPSLTCLTTSTLLAAPANMSLSYTFSWLKALIFQLIYKYCLCIYTYQHFFASSELTVRIQKKKHEY